MQKTVIELWRLWLPGAKIFLAMLGLSLLWGGLGWCFRALFGWLPETVYQIIGWALAIMTYPIGLYLAVDAVFKPAKRRL